MTKERVIKDQAKRAEEKSTGVIDIDVVNFIKNAIATFDKTRKESFSGKVRNSPFATEMHMITNGILVREKEF